MRWEQGADFMEWEVTGYEFPDRIPSGEGFDDDANWLVLSCRKSIGGRWQEGRAACLQTVDVERVVRLLTEYQDGRVHAFSFGGPEPNFYLRLKRIQSPNRHRLTLFFWNESGGESYGAAKEWVKIIDNGELEALRLFWRQVQTDFPVR